MHMTEGCVQLAMNESDDRKKRDARAIRWVIDNLTEDSELEPFILGIPGSLSSTWGRGVWETFSKGEEIGNVQVLSPANDDLKLALVPLNSGHPIVQPATGIAPMQRESSLHDLGSRTTQLLKTYRPRHSSH